MVQQFKPDYIVSADETFIKFYETSSNAKVIAGTGARRVNKGFKVSNEKEGVTVMVSTEFYTNQLLKPFFVLEGTWNGKLMKEFENRESSVVLFNKGHWMSGPAYRVWLESLKANYKGKLLLVVDSFTVHDSEETLQFLESSNKESETEIKQLIIPPGCTSILQVADVGINHEVKKEMRKAYNLAEGKFREQKRTLEEFKENNVLKYDRKEFIEMVEEGFKNLNEKEGTWLQELYNKCGQNPRDKNMCLKKFRKHLEEVKEYNTSSNK